MTGGWGKAGVRRDPRERERRRNELGRARAFRQQHEREAEQKWRTGQVVPDRITQALNLRKLYGPEVDAACGVAEPAVDQWEAGELYPSWEQLRALAALTDFPVAFFVIAAAELVTDAGSLRFHMPDVPLSTARVVEFSPAALAWAAAEWGVEPAPPRRAGVPELHAKRPRQ